MANNKILPHVAMSMYEDELDFILPASAYDELVTRRIAMEVDECYKQYEQEKAERIALETELAWDVYFWDEYYEGLFVETLTNAELDYYDNILAVSTEVEGSSKSRKHSQKFFKFSRSTVPYRRKQEIRHKKKLCRNAINAMNNLRKRNCEDLNNMADYNHRFLASLAMSEGESLSWYADKVTYCKRRGGHLVQMPKSLSIKAENIWARAAKMKLV